MFEPEEQSISTGEPGQEAGSVLQRYLSQLGMPLETVLPGNDLPSTDSPVSLRLPRYYGAPPDHLPANQLTVNSPRDANPSGVAPSNAMERIRPLLQIAANSALPSKLNRNAPNTYTPSVSNSSLATRIGLAQPGVSAGTGDSGGVFELPNAQAGQPHDAFLSGSSYRRSSPIAGLGSRILALTSASKTNTTSAPLPSNTSNGLANGVQFPTTPRVLTRATQNVTDPVTGGNLLAAATKPVETKLREAVATAGAAADGGNAARKTATASGQPKKKEGSSRPILQGRVGRPQAGADNQPEDVKVIQQLLNAAIDNGDLTGKKIPEDGKITVEMLKMIDEYQNQHIRGVQPDQPGKPGTPAKIRLIDQKSSTLKQLRQNPFADERWNRYDGAIKDVLKEFNDKFPNSGVDWQLVKAMLWQESGGPDRGIEWTIWPMQIGRRAADKAIEDVIHGDNHTDLIATPEERKEIGDKFHHHRMTPELNIKAGIIYLLARKVASTKNVTDSGKTNKIMVRRGDTIERLAARGKTTKKQLLSDHPELETKPLQPGELLYSKAHWEPETWSDERTALHNYNSEIKNNHYADQVLKKHEAIKRKWPQ